MPGGKFDFTTRCITISDEELKDIKITEEEEKERIKQEYERQGEAAVEARAREAKARNTISSDTDTAAGAAKAISEMGAKLASKGSGSTPTAAFKKAFRTSGVERSERNHDSCHQVGMSCGSFVSTVVTAAGVDAKKMRTTNFADSILEYMKGDKDPWVTVKSPNGWKKGYSAQPGDVAIELNRGSGSSHTFVFIEYKGKLAVAEASHCDFYGVISKARDPDYVFRYKGN